MCKYLSFLFVLMFSFYASAQGSYILKGKVLNINNQLPLESATVYITTVKDSTILEYTLTDKNGNFNFAVKKNEKPVFLKVTYMGFDTFAEEQKEVSSNKDFNNIYLSESINSLKEVTVKSEDPPIRIKNDTIEFKASLFKVRPDANVEALLKQLPGIEVDNDGKITANGKEVTQVLVNGKPFFDRDGAMALKNLPAEIINKVQVSDFKTKKEEYSKDQAASDNSSINLTIDEDKNKGYFGKFLGGYGTDDRYESSFIVNYFNNNRKISLLGSSNNINAPGFSMDEVFDNMGGGRNNRGSNANRGQANGITRSNLVGFNYSDELFKKFEPNANYNYSDTNTQNKSHSTSTELRPDGNFYEGTSGSQTNSSNISHKANAELEYKISPSIRLFIAPKFNTSTTESNSESFNESRISATDTKVSSSNSVSKNRNESNNFSNSINFNKSFEKRTRNLSLVFNNNNSNSNANNFRDLETFRINKDSINRYQNIRNNNISDSYTAEIEYTEPITDSIRFKVGLEYNFQNSITDNKTFEKNNGNYTDLNDLQTTYISSKQNSITPKAGFRIEKNNFTFDINSSTSILQYNNNFKYLGESTDLNKKHILPNASAQIRYRVDRSKSLTTRYNYNRSLPSANQLLLENLSNPLDTIVGNPNLLPRETHSASFNYRNFDFRTRSGYNIFFNSEYNNNDIISTSIYNPDNSRKTTYTNISGTYSVSGGGNWNKSIKQESNLLRYGIALNASYKFEKGFTNGVLYGAKSMGFTPRIYLNYDYGEFFTVAPSYNFSYNETQYDVNTLKSRSNVVHRLNLQTTSYWPTNWTWGNDFGYTYNSINQDFYLWNTSLSYTFLNKNFIAKVKVYDVLNQNQNISRSISATAVTDSENTVLKRYAMFSLTYKIQNFSGTLKPPGRNNRNMDGMDRGDRPGGFGGGGFGGGGQRMMD